MTHGVHRINIKEMNPVPSFGVLGGCVGCHMLIYGPVMLDPALSSATAANDVMHIS